MKLGWLYQRTVRWSHTHDSNLANLEKNSPPPFNEVITSCTVLETSPVCRYPIKNVPIGCLVKIEDVVRLATAQFLPLSFPEKSDVPSFSILLGMCSLSGDDITLGGVPVLFELTQIQRSTSETLVASVTPLIQLSNAAIILLFQNHRMQFHTKTVHYYFRLKSRRSCALCPEPLRLCSLRIYGN